MFDDITHIPEVPRNDRANETDTKSSSEPSADESDYVYDGCGHGDRPQNMPQTVRVCIN